MRPLKLIKDAPTDGTQFVAIWIWEGKLWSDTFKYENYVIKKFDLNKDEWVPANMSQCARNVMLYFILGEEVNESKKGKDAAQTSKAD